MAKFETFFSRLIIDFAEGHESMDKSLIIAECNAFLQGAQELRGLLPAEQPIHVVKQTDDTCSLPHLPAGQPTDACEYHKIHTSDPSEGGSPTPVTGASPPPTLGRMPRRQPWCDVDLEGYPEHMSTPSTTPTKPPKYKKKKGK